MSALAWIQAAAPARVPAAAALPAGPPLSGVVWTVVVPALLLVFTALATYLLYRKFERQEKTHPEEP